MFFFNNISFLGTLQWVGKLKWPGIKGFTKAPKKYITFNDTRTGGFVKSFKQFSFFWILKAGHMVRSYISFVCVKLHLYLKNLNISIRILFSTTTNTHNIVKI